MAYSATHYCRILIPAYQEEDFSYRDLVKNPPPIKEKPPLYFPTFSPLYVWLPHTPQLGLYPPGHSGRDGLAEERPWQFGAKGWMETHICLRQAYYSIPSNFHFKKYLFVI